jgi:hypothetical protein
MIDFEPLRGTLPLMAGRFRNCLTQRGHLSRTRSRHRAGWIALSYAIFATLWIYFSDRAISVLFSDPDSMILVSVFKGVAFVGVTALLLYLLMQKTFGTIEKNYETLKANEQEIARLNLLYAALSARYKKQNF